MAQDIIYTGIVIGIILISLAVVTVRNNLKNNRRFLKQVMKNWGRAPGREYTYEEFESISHYAKRHQGDDFMIDDITWNDLDMDSIFMLANNTITSCGEEYLYYTLRKPAFSQEELDEKNRLIEFFRADESKRLDVQRILSAVGKTHGISLGDYIYRLQDIPRKSNFKYIFLALLMLFGIALLLMSPVAGICILFPLFMYDMVLHIREKGDIEIYLKCFECILHMCGAVGKLEKAAIPEIAAYTEKLKRAKKGLANFCAGSFLVTTSGTVAADLGSALLEYLKMLFHMDKIKFNSMLKQLDGHQEEVEMLMANLGALDSVIAIGSFREYLPYYSRGKFADEKTLTMEVHNLYHPLIDNPVANSITVQGGTLVTGSNASGKSTFLKNIAINCILAQTIDTAVSTDYRNSFVKTMTSMALMDSLESGESYYIVEIKSLKRILDESKKGVPLVCIIDEVLRGTNTIERIAASSQILNALNQDRVLPFAATHDIELSHILDGIYTNYHFEEELGEHDIRFNYELKTGRTNTRNAIRLLEIMDYDPAIVEEARKEAARFEETGEWSLC